MACELKQKPGDSKRLHLSVSARKRPSCTTSDGGPCSGGGWLCSSCWFCGSCWVSPVPHSSARGAFFSTSAR